MTEPSIIRYKLRTLLIVLAIVLLSCARQQPPSNPPALVIESGYIDENGKAQRKRQEIPLSKDNLEEVVTPILTED